MIEQRNRSRKYRVSTISSAAISIILSCIISGCTQQQEPEFNGDYTYSVVRLNNGMPIITPDMFAELGALDEGENINGPSVIRLPDWLQSSDRASTKANYYMYFARHSSDRVGDYIRMAWSETVEGPWTLYRVGADVLPGNRGVLDTGADELIPIPGGCDIVGSVGSPDIIVDHVRKRFVMYFHAGRGSTGEKDAADECKKRRSVAMVATSANGLDFNPEDHRQQPDHGIQSMALGRSYFRTFEVNSWLYAIANTGTIYRAPAPGNISHSEVIWGQPWERDDGPLQRTFQAEYSKLGIPTDLQPTFRHFAVLPVGDELHIFFSRKRDNHERIQMTVVDISGGHNWKQWSLTYPPQDILKPEMEWEGANLPHAVSKRGGAIEVRQLRDPYVLQDYDSSLYLFYTGSGEEAIGVARLMPKP